MRPASVAVGAIALAVAVAVTLGVRPVAAASATPCWQTVIADWSRDGSIDGKYAAACYRQAMQNAPTDLKIYSTLEDDLQSALRQRSSRRLAGAHASAASLDVSLRSSSLSFLAALIAGLGALLAVCSAVATLARRRARG
jgi:hypothetical protein